MLVLTRRNDESIIIGNDIEITVIGIEGDRVRIGIKAPSNIDIHRKEVYLSIQNENQEANNSINLLNEKELTKKLSKMIKQN
ncbi:carbon storage regulator [Fictibacillus halophilus]|uniref:Translational regulator CsrA n=1 Tax=Fictibacillus halophilus TaxID=1610490 RepID=A0ABV2LEJ8_9BACL|nr:carbon storage regulator CsrA [Fictibacillus halophilus]